MSIWSLFGQAADSVLNVSSLADMTTDEDSDNDTAIPVTLDTNTADPGTSDTDTADPGISDTKTADPVTSDTADPGISDTATSDKPHIVSISDRIKTIRQILGVLIKHSNSTDIDNKIDVLVKEFEGYKGTIETKISQANTAFSGEIEKYKEDLKKTHESLEAQVKNVKSAIDAKEQEIDDLNTKLQENIDELIKKIGEVENTDIDANELLRQARDIKGGLRKRHTRNKNKRSKRKGKTKKNRIL